MSEKHTFQSIILKLQQYWADRGCVIWQPYYTQVGAGTMNPATFLKVLGPETWNVAYVEPSVRPDDGRYGENPNRLQMHYQFQVVLKPDPGNPQELYLESLKAIGIDPRKHDIRFVEDNWEQPAISAWGLGWEVWLDGQEITQFTYFQQVGGIALDPVAVEITYGLDRILIALNDAPSIWNEPWSDDIKYGDIRRQEEFEHSKYYYEVADVERAHEMYELFAAECLSCLDKGLVLPAHDYVLKCSHTFNIMDARGAVGVTERQAYFRRMRDMARRVAEAYLEQRKLVGYNLSKVSEQSLPPTHPLPPVDLRADKPQAFLLEIGVEELPAGDVDVAQALLEDKVAGWFKSLDLAYGEIQVYTTPRRLSVLVDGLAAMQPDREELVKGPPADRAFTVDGTPTPAAIGFAAKNGVVPAGLMVQDIDNGKYVVARVFKTGQHAVDVLAAQLPSLIAEIKFDRSMKWNDSGVSFSRPIRWLVALFGGQIIPFQYAGVHSGAVSRGLRPYDSPEIRILSASDYLGQIEKAGILLDGKTRSTSIEGMVNSAAGSLGGKAFIDPGLLQEVTNLIEKPAVIVGSFDPEFLTLPRDVLISTMKKHQRYFPVEEVGGTGEDGYARLLPKFIAIRNGDDQFIDVVAHGNEHVLGARFADANYFVREDVKKPLEFYRDGLSTLIFQTKLGSMLEKSNRISALAPEVAKMLKFDPATITYVARAGFLSKADLTTQMVTEMTSLQGIIGREYALRSGERPEVAVALGEQYQLVPKTSVGLAIAIADRIDSLVGLFTAGVIPSGAKDPFGLRRAAIGIVQPLLEHNLSFDLMDAIERAAAIQPIAGSATVNAQVLAFITGRLKVVLGDMGFRYDLVDAILDVNQNDPARALKLVAELTEWVARPNWSNILDSFARCVRIIRSTGKKEWLVDQALFTETSEKELFLALVHAEAKQLDSIEAFLIEVEGLAPTINAFFNNVLVMAEDEKVKNNRLGLVSRVAALASGLVDMGKLEGF